MLKHLGIVGIFVGLLSAGICMGVELKNDNGSMGNFVYYSASWAHCYPYYGVRLTPTGNCQVTGAKLYMYKYEGAWKQSTIYVRNNNGGSPGTTTTSATFTPSSNGWYTVNFSTQPSYSGDFFLVITLGTSGAGYMETGLGLDNNGASSNRNVASEGGMWEDPTTGGLAQYYTGDFMMRAVVTYVGAEETELLPATTQLNSVMPNPITTKTTISYMLAENSKVSVTIYDISGKLVRALSNETQSAGTKILDWNTKDNLGNKVSSGMYFCKLNVNGKAISTKSLIVL